MTQDGIKDPDREHPIAQAWRPVLRSIVDAFVRRNFTLAGVRGVRAISAADAGRIEANILDYGETLVTLPDDTWSSSVAQWMGGHWDALIDLWTEESGCSDLVLRVRVFADAEHDAFEVRGVYVP